MTTLLAEMQRALRVRKAWEGLRHLPDDYPLGQFFQDLKDAERDPQPEPQEGRE